MLAEKFILVLEAILRFKGRHYPDGAPRGRQCLTLCTGKLLAEN